jgi:hypothetical protein
METLNQVASLTAVLEGLGGKLLLMRVLVAVGTGAKLQLVHGLTARGLVALLTFQVSVFPGERVRRRLVICLAESCGDKALLVVAGAAVASLFAGFELSPVRVFGVTVAAVLMGDGLAELDPAVALTTRESAMLAGKREAGLGMIEVV